MPKETSGWVKLHRKIIEGDRYFTEPFCRNMAWVDLILLANHKPGIIRKRGVRVDLKRGDIGMGTRELSARWQWSRGKVFRFLNELESDQKIVQQKNNITNCITLLNYQTYQDGSTTDDTTSSTTDGPQTGHRQYQNKNVKNEENENKGEKAALPPPFKKLTEKEFYDSLKPFVKDYSKEMLRAFYDYWSEKNENGKMLFQIKNKTWEIKKRLAAWASKKFDNLPKNGKQHEIPSGPSLTILNPQ